MFSPSHLRASSVAARVDALTEVICGASGIDEDSLVSVSESGPTPVAVSGRVCGDVEVEEGLVTLQEKSVWIEDAQDGARVRLILSDPALHSYRLFPGQVVVAKGTNTHGEGLRARILLTPPPPPLSLTPVYEMQRQAKRASALGVVVAGGPFSLHDGDTKVSYAPFDDLLAAIVPLNPNLIVLVGPFVDATSPAIARGRPKLQDGSGAWQSLAVQDLWDVCIAASLSSLLRDSLPHTHVVLVPSPKDLLADPVFPQAPLSDRLHASFDPDIRPRVHLLPNPATFSFRNVTFGTTGADPLFDLARRQITKHSSTPPPDLVGRTAAHLLEQRSFYPVFPPDQDTPLDLSLYPHVELPCSPDVLLLPSALTPKLMPINNATLLVAPGTAVRGGMAAREPGFFATLHIQPPQEKRIRPLLDEDIDALGIDQESVKIAAEAELPLARHAVPARTKASVICL